VSCLCRLWGNALSAGSQRYQHRGFVGKDRKPIPGEPVELYGIPDTDVFEPIRATGRYVGRFRTVGTLVDTNVIGDRMLDWVAFKAPSPETDACEFGSSGSLAVTASELFLGPLDLRLSLGYGPQGHRHYPGRCSICSDRGTEPGTQIGH